MNALDNISIKIFADGADYDSIVSLYRNPRINGFTTNPTLMRKAGILDYEAFARKVLRAVPDRPVSFEVFADDFPTMIAQGRRIASWGSNANVKVPVTNTQGRFCGAVIEALSGAGAAAAAEHAPQNRPWVFVTGTLTLALLPQDAMRRP